MGYIGSRLLAHLDTVGKYEIIATSRRSEIPEIVSQLRNVKVCTIDYTSSALLIDLLKDQEFVVNLAASNEILAGKDPVAALLQTAGNTWRILEAVDTRTLKLFIQFSTIHVYGNPLPSFIEEISPTMPGHGYAIAHMAAEQLVYLSARQKNFRHLVVRLGNTIGPPLYPGVDRWTLLVNDLCTQAVSQGKLVLRTNGQQWRNFIALEEVCQFVQKAIDNRSLDDHIFTGIINLVGNHNMTVLEMAKLVRSRFERVLGHDIPLHVPFDEGVNISERLFISRSKMADWGAGEACSLENEIDELLRFCNEINLR